MLPPNVLNAYEETFQQTVIERSRDVPILVDFWAAWCGPCRILTPILEELAGEGEGQWLLVKVNSDNSPNLTRHYRVQGIPNCLLFKNGEVVDSFVGVQSKAAVQRFLQKWLPTKEDLLIDGAEAQITQGNFDQARQTLDGIVATTPDHQRARLTLAKLELAEGKPDEALEHLEYLPAEGQYERDIEILTAQAHLAQNREGSDTSLDTLQAEVAANPTDLDKRFELGNAAASVNNRNLAAEQFLAILEKDRAWNEGAARLALIDLFTLWGDDALETEIYRKKMSWILFV